MGKTEALVLEREFPQEQADYLRHLAAIREKRAFERRRLPFLKTVLDFDIACEVGYHHFADSPLTVKRLLLQGHGPTITVLRRLNRLRALGIVVRTRSAADGRVHELRLHPDAELLFVEYSRFHAPSAG